MIWQMNAPGLSWSSAPVWPAVWMPPAGSTTSPFPVPPQPSVASVRCADFTRNVGVNHHQGWTGTVYANLPVAKAALAYLGVTLVRDAVPWSDAVAADYAALAAGGVRFNLVLGPKGQDMTASLPGELARISTMGASVVAIEGPNELNGQVVTFNGAPSSDPAVGAAIQRFVASKVRTVTFAGKRLVNISLTNGDPNWQNYLNGLGDLSGSCDVGNWHVYFNGGSQPTANLSGMRQYAQKAAPGRPVIYTETGYFTAYGDTSGWGGTDEATQAKNTLNLLAAAAKMGIAQVFLYELLEGVLNPSNTDIENTFGLFHSDGRPKPVADAIHNLFIILADPAPSASTFVQTSVPYTIAGLPSTGASLLLQKASGAYELLIWNEATNWNLSTRTPIPVASSTVTVTLGTKFGTLRVYDPISQVTPIRTLSAVNSIGLSLADRLQVVELLTPMA